jgi:hypothetical protein
MTVLCFTDVESTGLDARIHKPWEVCTWLETEDAPQTRAVPHDLVHADGVALKVGGYWERADSRTPRTPADPASLGRRLNGVTLVGANPAFDAAMLTGFIGAAVWHYRMIDVSTGAMWVFGWDRPRSLLDTAAACRDKGYDIPEPDHTSEGDVRAVRAVYYALRDVREGLG